MTIETRKKNQTLRKDFLTGPKLVFFPFRGSRSFIRGITILTIFSEKKLLRYVNDPSKHTPYITIVQFLLVRTMKSDRC